MDKLNSLIRGFFSDKSHVVSAYIFGSYARGCNTPESDVDIAILCTPGYVLDPLDLIDWKQALSELLHKEVDLVCLNNISPILGMQVQQCKKTVFAKNETLSSLYLMKLFSDYAELKELRAPMEKDILKRKFYD